MNQVQRIFAVVVACLSVVATAQEATDEESSSEIEEITVLAHPLADEGLAQANDVIEADELDRKAVDNIGATVGSEPGIHNSSYGAGAGRPVIHGLGGARVRIMEERIDTLDVSVSSGDHAVTVDPFVAERVEVLKGSATLLYGSGAIGGVVDVHTGRIPEEVPERIHGNFGLRGTDNGNGRNWVLELDGGGNFAWHIDAFSRETEDYDIPGFAESAALHAAEEEEHHDEDEHDEDEHENEEEHQDEHEEEAYGNLPGSAIDVSGGAVGFSIVGDRGFVGVSVSGLNSVYGIPGHSHAHENDDHDEDEHHDEDDEDHADDDDHEEHEEDGETPPVVDLEQTRVDFESDLTEPFGDFESLNLRLGINDYKHAENEAGEVGTIFENRGWEGRAELSHGLVGGWEGAFGAQLGNREFSVAGEEASTPPVDTSSFGMFWVGERSVGELGLEAGFRFDRVEHSPETGSTQDFGGISASLGFIVSLNEFWQGTLLLDHSTRAPVGEELFSNAPHPGTGVFELGDPGLDPEQARNLTSTFTGRDDDWTIQGTVYFTSFSDFIYQGATGEMMHGFEVYRYSQADSTFTGFEVEGRVTVAEWPAGRLEIGAFFDRVSPKLDISGNDNLPLIPPDRTGVSLEFSGNRLRANVDYVRAAEQDDVAEFELPSDSYDDLRARVSWRINPGDMAVDLFLAGRNLTDDEQRLHTSVIKDLAPQQGRTIEVGMSMHF